MKIKKCFFYITLFTFIIGICFLQLVPDNDLWARLIAGGNIVETLHILKQDFLSYTPTHNWYDHEWGASIFLYLALKHFSQLGLILLKGLLCCLTVFICIQTVKINKKVYLSPYDKILYFALMFFAATDSIGLITRCLLFTSLFFALFLYILELSRKGKTKYLYFLPLIMLFWCNIHGGCIAGLGLIGLYIAGEFLNKKPVKQYILVLIASLLVLFINPYGIEYVKFLFYAALLNRELISEWNGSFINVYSLQYLKYKFYLIFLLSVQLIYLSKQRITYEKLDKTKFIIIFFLCLLSIFKVRHQAFFIFTAGTLLYNEFYTLLELYKSNLSEKSLYKLFKLNKLKEVLVYIILLSVSISILVFKPKKISITESEYPRFAIEFIRINNLNGNLFINFNWGSYAAYKLYPNNLVVMDGRYEEVYNPKLLEDMRDFHMLKNDWYKIIRDYKTDVMILEKKYPVYEKIKSDSNWALIFENNLSGVFIPSNKVKKQYLQPVFNDEYYNKTLFDTQIKYKKSS